MPGSAFPSSVGGRSHGPAWARPRAFPRCRGPRVGAARAGPYRRLTVRRPAPGLVAYAKCGCRNARAPQYAIGEQRLLRRQTHLAPDPIDAVSLAMGNVSDGGLGRRGQANAGANRKPRSAPPPPDRRAKPLPVRRRNRRRRGSRNRDRRGGMACEERLNVPGPGLRSKLPPHYGGARRGRASSMPAPSKARRGHPV